MKRIPTLAFFVLGLSLSALSPPVYAQEAPKPATISIDPNTVRKNLYDLALLRSIQRVNLSSDQIQDMGKLVKEILEADKARRKKDDDDMRDLADTVKKVHDGALNGEPIPLEFETKYMEVQKAINARIGTAKRESVEKILTKLWPTLTEDQKTEIEKQSILFYGTQRIPAAYRDNPKKAPRNDVLKLAAGAFIENVLLDDRIPTLLESLKPLKTTGDSSDSPAKP